MTGSSAMVMRSVLFLFLVLCAQGCADKIDPDLIMPLEIASQLHAGNTLEEVRALAGAAGRFDFQALTDEGEVSGLVYRVGSGVGSMIFVFRDNALEKICLTHWGGHALVTKANGKRTSVMVPTDPRHRLARILRREALMGEELLAYAHARAVPRGKGDPIPNDLIPRIFASIIAPPILIVWIQHDLDFQKWKKERVLLQERLAHDRIQLGMSPQEVQAVYGEPYSTQEFGRVMGCEYGSKRLHAWIAVEYLDNKVRAKYSQRFYPNDWTGELRKQVLSECDPGSLKEDYLPPYRSRQKK